jgi:hypothetical protein
MLPSSFVHVFAITEDNGDLLLKCSCPSYNLIQKAALSNSNLAPGVDDILDPSMTCMHCRFYKEKLSDIWDTLGDSSEGHTIVEKKAMAGFVVMDKPVVLVSDALPHATTKLSVRGEGNLYSFVNLTFKNGLCWVRCTEGVCSAQALNKKKVSKIISLLNPPEKKKKRKTSDKPRTESEKEDERIQEMANKLCTHLSTLAEHIQEVRYDLPELFFAEGDVEGGGEDVPGEVEVPNNDDHHLQEHLKGGVFNKETGLWSYPALSDLSPRQMEDDILIRSVSQITYIVMDFACA